MTRPQSGKLKFSGIIKDVQPAECPPGVWTDGRNVMFRSGRTERVPGEARFANTGRLFDTDRDWHIDNGTTRYWIYAGATPGGSVGVAVTDGVTHWNITPSGWIAISSTAKVLTLGDLNGVFWINHPELGAYWWDGDVTHHMTKLPGWPVNWSVDVMRAHKNWLVGFALDDGTNYYGGRVVWSTSAAPGSIPAAWTPSATNDAGDGDFDVPTGPILDAISVRDALFVSKNNYTGVMQYIGGQYIFRLTDVFPSLGIFATGACVEAGNMVYMMTGSREIIRHDGTSYTNILYGKLQDYVGKQINYQYTQSIFMYRDEAAGQVMLCYPVGNSRACTEAVSIEIASGDPGIRDLPGIYGAAEGETLFVAQTWDADAGAWQDDTTVWNQNASGYTAKSIVFAASAQGLLEQGAATTQWTPSGPALLPARVERTGIDFDDLDGRKSIMGLVPLVSGNVGDTLSFQIGQQTTPSGAVDLSDVQSYAIGVDDHIDVQIDGRFGAIYAASLGGQPWQLGTLAPLVARRGRW
jgi:hypothetical protein